MSQYTSNKLRTISQIISRIENWPTALGMRLQRHRSGLRLLNFRNGLNVMCRGGTRDWDVIHELLFAGSYRRATQWLKQLPGQPVVLDLGGNIGLFSLLAAAAHPGAEIHSYEPGPPNFQLFEINLLVNETLGGRIHLHKEAVAGTTRATEWFFNAANPGGSSLFGSNGSKFPVQIRAFKEVVDFMPRSPELVKIDIEGAEFELLSATPAETRQPIKAVSIEIHNDPHLKVSKEEFLGRLADYGFTIEEENVISYFLHR